MPPSPASALPTLDTERLTLRVHTVADFDDSAAMWGDANVTRYVFGRPLSAEETWSRLLRYAGLWSLVGYGFWVVRERATGRFVGEVGLADFHRAVVPALGGAPEAGWVLASWAHGRGFATEAVRAVLAWSDSHLHASRVVCLIAPENAGSLRVAAKCGFRESSQGTYNGSEILIFER